MKFRREIIHSMLRRCHDWDYRQRAIYQITLVLADRKSKALGQLVIPPDSPDNARIELSHIGEAVLKEWKNISIHHPEVKPLFMQIMPDHVHGILQVLKPMAKPLGNIIGGFKTGSSKASIGTGGLWAAGFQDSILFRDGQLDAMFNYLRDNPRRLAIKKLMPDLFRVRREIGITLMLPHQAQQAAAGAARDVAGTELPRLRAYFSAIGNIHLLDEPNIIQIQCSRSHFQYKRIPKPGGGRKIAIDSSKIPIAEIVTPEFEELQNLLISATKRGAVLVSPAISDGEREIARLAHEAGAKVIVLKNMGFSPLYKPGGKLFDKTANGKLLLLAPIAWPYSSQNKPITRLDACVLID